MKKMKKLFSLVMVLAMLFTFASFPANAYTYTPKTVELAGSQNPGGGYAGPYFLARPTNNFYVGDSVTLPDNGTPMLITVPQRNGENIIGFIVNYGKKPTDLHTDKLYVKIDSSGNMTGFYPTLDDMKAGTNKTNLTFDSEGKWVLSIKYLIESNGSTYDLSGQGENSLHNVWVPLRWTVDVKSTPTSDPTVEVPAVDQSIKDNADSIRSSIKTDPATFNDGVGENHAYVIDVNGDASIDSSLNYQAVKATFAEHVAPVDGMQIDFATVSYIKEVSVSLRSDISYILYDVFGSLDGENWFVISTDNTTSSNKIKATVDSAVKHVRIDYRDYKQHWGKCTTTLDDVVGVLNIFPTETYKVTFKHITTDGETKLDDVEVETDKKGKYTVPAPFNDEKYQYYTTDACTVRLDTTKAVTADTTVYVKLAPAVDGVVKVGVVPNPKGYCGINFIERPINNLVVGNEIALSDNAVFETVPVFSSKKVAKVKFWYGVNGGAVKELYMTIDPDTGKASGFYSNFACTSETNVILDQEGIWMFYLRDWYDINDTSLNSSFTNLDGANIAQCREMFYFDVKAADYEAPSAPSVRPGILNNCKDLLSTFDQNVTESDTKNVIYYEYKTINGSSESKLTLTGGNRATLATTSTRLSLDAIRLDFTTNTYIKNLTIERGNPDTYFKYNVLGSLDGENWYVISENNTSTTKTLNVTVNAIAKYLRIDQVAGYAHWGTTNSIASLKAITGYEDADSTWSVKTEDGKIQVSAMADEFGVVNIPDTFTNVGIDADEINVTAGIWGEAESLKLNIPSEVLSSLTVPMHIEIFGTKTTLTTALMNEIKSADATLELKPFENGVSVSFVGTNPTEKVRVMTLTATHDPAAVITNNGDVVKNSGIVDSFPTAYVSLPANVGYLTNNFTLYEDAQQSENAQYIRFVSARDLINGVSQYEFLPEAPFKKHTLVSALMSLANGNATYTGAYTDVNANAPYASAAQWYKDNFDNSDNFNPEQNLTASEAADIIKTVTGMNVNASGNSTLTRGEGAKLLTETLRDYNRINEVVYPTPEFDENNIVLSFVAMSDVHIDSSEYNTAAQKYEGAINYANELANGNLDLVFIAGDVNQNLMYAATTAEKAQDEINGFKKHNDNFLPEGTGLIFCTGNHDYISSHNFELDFYNAFTATEADKERYYSYDVVEDCDYTKGNRHAIINGYHFLSIGMHQFDTAYVTGILDKITAEDPNKPVFVQYHFHAEDTVYETYYGDDAEFKTAKNVLSNYPQVVYFSGHTHDSTRNSRAIWQGGFTALDTGSVRELDEGGIINWKSGAPINMTHAEARNDVGEGTLVQVDKNNNVRFISYSVINGNIMAERVMSAPNAQNTHLTAFTNDRERFESAPIFRENSHLTLTKNSSGGVEVFFDAATHDDVVWYYDLTFTTQGESKKTFKFTSRYFDKNGMPDELTGTIEKSKHNLTEGKTYTVTLTAYNVWDQPSESIVINYVG